MASRAPMPSATGNASLVATAPPATSTSMICSVPYAVELIASEENTARATTLPEPLPHQPRGSQRRPQQQVLPPEGGRLLADRPGDHRGHRDAPRLPAASAGAPVRPPSPAGRHARGRGHAEGRPGSVDDDVWRDSQYRSATRNRSRVMTPRYRLLIGGLLPGREVLRLRGSRSRAEGVVDAGARSRPAALSGCRLPGTGGCDQADTAPDAGHRGARVRRLPQVAEELADHTAAQIDHQPPAMPEDPLDHHPDDGDARWRGVGARASILLLPRGSGSRGGGPGIMASANREWGLASMTRHSSAGPSWGRR